jgi:hypothetical protein
MCSLCGAVYLQVKREDIEKIARGEQPKEFIKEIERLQREK